jgi:hypothetical protein
LEECLSPEVGHGEPEDGNLVEFVDDSAVERQDGSQVVQFAVKPLSAGFYATYIVKI